jgi:hypothetical protein
MRETSSTEFVEWCAIMDFLDNELTIDRAYLTQLTTEVRRSFVAKPQDVDPKMFILKMVPKAPEPTPEEEREKRKKQALLNKNVWSGVVLNSKVRRAPKLGETSK